MDSFKELLIQLGLSSKNSISVFYPKVRDNQNIQVLKCKESGVIFLSTNAFSQETVYKNKQGFSYWRENTSDRIPLISPDDYRRRDTFSHFFKNKIWLDFGCGAGGLLQLCSSLAVKAVGLELQPRPRQYLRSKGIQCAEEIDEIKDESLDIITMFHVFEHLPDPINLLKKLKSKLINGGTLIIEVPHANDALLSLYDIDAFKAFTFWSEHLILHTINSLELFITKAGLKINSIYGFQRYPLSNHLYWLAQSLPQGEQKWTFLNNPILAETYAQTLQSIGKTDTLIAVVEKGYE